MLSKNTYVVSDETKKKLSDSHKGQVPWNKGMSTPRKKPARYKKIVRDIICSCGNNKYYSAKNCMTCAGKLRAGEKNSNWKGGAKDSQAERVKFHETIRVDVLKRDNYTCQLCNEKGGKLQVDHIKSWAEYVEGRFCIDNCRTVCMGCHYKITFNKEMPADTNWGGHINTMKVN